MRGVGRVAGLWLLAAAVCPAFCQQTAAKPPQNDGASVVKEPQNGGAVAVKSRQSSGGATGNGAAGLPDAPNPQQSAAEQQKEPGKVMVGPANCVSEAYTATNPEAATEALVFAKPCRHRENPFDRFLSTSEPEPMTPRQKLVLAGRDFIDPENGASIAFFSALDVATDAHGSYGPGMHGFGYEFGVSLSQDAMGETFGTFAVPSLMHQDPHYHRMPGAGVWPRMGHVLMATLVMQSDEGRPMANYGNLISTPLCEEMFNLYVPGLRTNLPSTAARVGVDLATDPISNAITEFVPDVARRINVREVVLQRIVRSFARQTGTTYNF